MNLYITTGSLDFMKAIRDRHPQENMIAMEGAGHTILVHETEGPTKFETPQSYKVIESKGQLTEHGYFALNYLPVQDESRPIFEHQLKIDTTVVEQQPACQAIRFLQPVRGNTYVFLTEWKDHASFLRWQGSETYERIFTTGVGGELTAKTPHLFDSAPYVTTFKSIVEDEK